MITQCFDQNENIKKHWKITLQCLSLNFKSHIYEDNICFTNPGALAMPLNKALVGGTSDARNKTILAMFNNIKIGERGGTEIPKI